MQDRPTYDELLAAVEAFLDAEIVPNLEGARGFHTRVAANALRTVRRELAAEWAGLDVLLGRVEAPGGRAALRDAIRGRNAELCARTRRGGADSGPFAEQVREHVRRTVRDKLSVSDPGLLERSEASSRARD